MNYMFDWIEKLADFIVYQAFNLHPNTAFSKAFHFFIYDTVKILFLLVIVIFIMGVVNSYFPVEKVKHFLSRNKLFGMEYLIASLFGVVTPFCSCSSIPLFIGFVKNGIPLGVTFAFLVTSPLVNEVAIGLFVGLFGLKTTLIYVISGVVLGTLSGVILQKLKLEKYLNPWVIDMIRQTEKEQSPLEDKKQSLILRIPYIWKEVVEIIKKILPYVVLGIAVGSLMHGYIPEGFFEVYMRKDNWFAVPLSVLLAVPMYSNASGILPVVQVLVAKGIPLGTSIAFMMGVVGLSLPEAMLLKKIMHIKLIGIFFGVVTVCIILSGYVFNVFL